MTALAALTACDSDSFLSQVQGHYEGSLTDHSDGKTYKETSVFADIDSSDTPLTLAVKDAKGNTGISLQISDVADDALTLQSSLGLKQAVRLALDTNVPGSECFRGVSDVKITLCATAPEISLEIQNLKDGTDILSVVLHHFDRNGVIPPAEKPRAFTLSEAINRARTLSFASRIEFEHVVQAKLYARASYLHLLPQITMSTILNNVTVAPLNFVGTFTAALQDIGDLAPFLIPSRWFQADANEQQSKAEQDTQILMKLDTGVQVEGLFYAYDRDKKSRDLTRQFLLQLVDPDHPDTGIRHEIKTREDYGQIAEGSTLNIDLIVNQVQQSLGILEQVTTEDRGAISQSLGYYNPTTVSDATIDAELVPIEQAQPADFNTINAVASCQNPNGDCRSYELQQMDYLIAEAKDAKTLRYFAWLDPNLDPTVGSTLGFALPTELEINNSQIKELTIDRQQLQSVLSGKVLNAVTDLNQALSTYQLAQAGVKEAQNLLNLTMVNLGHGVNEDMFALTTALQNLLNANITLQTSIANYRVARSEIDRLLLQGYYAKF